MGKDDLVRDSLREGLKAKGRSRRESAANLAKTANDGCRIRNEGVRCSNHRCGTNKMRGSGVRITVAAPIN
jgi:hypothetical protein